MNAELLYEALNDQHSLEQLNRQELDKLVSEHPYFSIGQLLLAKKFRQERDEDSYQVQRACVQAFYRNPWWLYYQLELSDNTLSVPRSPYAPVLPYTAKPEAPVPAVAAEAPSTPVSTEPAAAVSSPFESIARQSAAVQKPSHVPSGDEEETISAYPLFPAASGRETNEPIPGQNHAFVPWPDLDEPIAPTLAAALPFRGAEVLPAEEPAAQAEAREAAELPEMPFMVTPVLPGGDPEPAEQPVPPTPAEQPSLPNEAPWKDPPETPGPAPAELPNAPEEMPETPEHTPPGHNPSEPEEIPGSFPKERPLETPREIPEETPREAPGNIPPEMPSTVPGPELPSLPGAEPEAIPAAASAETFPFSITPLNTGLTFEPFHTVDYFASQGIRLDAVDENATDKLSQHLKSFTEWLRTMKRINPTQPIREELDTATEAEIQHLASNANHQKEAVVTESMAQVWVQQGKVHKAIEVYNKLSLQHPEKRAYFAAKIEQLNKQ